MIRFFVQILLFVLLVVGIMLLFSAILFHDRSFYGKKTLGLMNKWQKGSKDLWDNVLLQKLTAYVSRFVYLDNQSLEKLERDLTRAGIEATPEQFTARNYIILVFSGVLLVFCILLKFWIGVILVALLAVFLLLKQRELLTSKLKAKDEAISMEMPRFVRTICRNLRTNRDIFAVLQSYRKVAGPVLGAELDILLTQMRTGSITTALQQFQSRLGSEEAYRLCSTLLEIDRGIDQIATLDYLADDMARQAKINVEKILSTRPAKMRRTYLPAVGICVIMIFYVLIVFVTNQLNGLF